MIRGLFGGTLFQGYKPRGDPLFENINDPLYAGITNGNLLSIFKCHSGTNGVTEFLIRSRSGENISGGIRVIKLRGYTFWSLQL